MRLPITNLPLLSLLLLAACSFSLPDSTRRTPYQSPGSAADSSAPEENSARDLESCRRSADRSMGADAAIDPADEHTGDPMVLARREQLRGNYQTLVDQCMGRPR